MASQPKLRQIFVALHADSQDDSPARKRSKYVISMPQDATNADLAEEVAKTFDVSRDGICLEIRGGFELRDQDEISALGENDIVTARIINDRASDEASYAESSSPRKRKIPAANTEIEAKTVTSSASAFVCTPTEAKLGSKLESEGRQILFVTAEMARLCANAKPMDTSEPNEDFGAYAFGGAKVGGNITLASLKTEAADVLRMKHDSANTMAVDTCSHCKNQNRGPERCSCAIANEIKSSGLLSSMHCRLSVDGSECAHGDKCPYSHVPLPAMSTKIPPHCAVCGDALGFPCHRCQETIEEDEMDPQNYIYCPLVSNAGCGHLHHAHCLGLHIPTDAQKKTYSTERSSESCPSGCPKEKYPLESTVFSLTGAGAAHIILAWDGCEEANIMYIPIPSSLSAKNGQSFVLDTSVIVGVVREFFVERHFKVPDCGLMIQVFNRDALREKARLTQSILVSVCATSMHRRDEGVGGRFELFTAKDGYVSRDDGYELTKTSNFKPSKTPEAVYQSTIDFHTSAFPITTLCDCATLGELGLISSALRSPEPLVLYVVERKSIKGSDRQLWDPRKTTFLNSPAWHPAGTTQTDRGIACLLSSLYVMAEVVSHREQSKLAMKNFLAMVYMMSRFPPAVRSFALVIKNAILLPQEQAALAVSLYHCIKAFAYDAPSAIIHEASRLFETSRILLGWLMTAIDASASTLALGEVVEDVSLLCASSDNPLIDPVLWGASISERRFVALHTLRAELYKPSHRHQTSFNYTELPSDHPVLKALYALKQYNSWRTSVLVLNADRIGTAPASYALRLELAGRDFTEAIRRSNGTELVTRGPLDLKAPAIIPPQIVLDSLGYLAVFTGRGCGSTRDANFYRPTADGDTEVDINDVANALDKIVPLRQAEKTWDIDSFSGVQITSRDPEEAIVLCLDLSQSMNKRSGVEHVHQSSRARDDRKDEEDKVLRDLTSDLSTEEILENALAFLDEQHWTTRVGWKSIFEEQHEDELARDKDEDEDEDEDDDNDHREVAQWQLLEELEIVARRDLVQISAAQNREMSAHLQKLACFIKACVEEPDDVWTCLTDLINEASVDGGELVGTEPCVIPREFMDPKSGDMLDDPCIPHNAPGSIYISATSLSWFEDLGWWPRGPFVDQDRSRRELKSALSDWISGKDLLPRARRGRKKAGSPDDLSITLKHNDKSITWNLPRVSTTRLLYSLANRATRARYSSFSIKIFGTWSFIADSPTLRLDSSNLRNGGEIELVHAMQHRRQPFILHSTDLLGLILLPGDATVMALFSYLHRTSISRTTIWSDLQDVGDNHSQGTPIDATFGTSHYLGTGNLSFPLSSGEHNLECRPLHVEPTETDQSRYLTRLHLLKELFNVFLNRACSFDTTVPLVLGLVTFSDKAKISQELTPLFERFREELGRVEASGDTCVYDALDLARSMLVKYRADLPNLRKRIIVVSDGEDTSSKQPAVEVLAALQKRNIIVDSVQVGSAADRALHGISVVTGGYRFCPKTSLSDALSIFDLETVLNSGERPVQSMPRGRVITLSMLTSVYGNTHTYPVDVVTIDKFPKRAEHAKLYHRVKPLDLSYGRAVGLASDDRMKRIMRETRNLIMKPSPYMDVYVDEQDITFLRIVTEAPNGVDCLYRSGVYLLTCEFPEGYPRDPPQIRFVNFIMHPNVSKQGKVCIAELGRLWSADMSMSMALQLVYQIFTHPDLENPLETQASMKYYDDDGTYALSVAQAVKDHASKTRAQWKAQLNSED